MPRKNAPIEFLIVSQNSPRPLPLSNAVSATGLSPRRYASDAIRKHGIGSVSAVIRTYPLNSENVWNACNQILGNAGSAKVSTLLSICSSVFIASSLGFIKLNSLNMFGLILVGIIWGSTNFLLAKATDEPKGPDWLPNWIRIVLNWKFFIPFALN